MYFRVKRTGTYAYLQIVESFRENRQVRQRVLSTVGRLDVLQATGQLETLLRSGLRFCEKLAVIDAHAAGQTEAVAVDSEVINVDGLGFTEDSAHEHPDLPFGFALIIQGLHAEDIQAEIREKTQPRKED